VHPPRVSCLIDSEVVRALLHLREIDDKED
jgi:hypothetical protein